MRPAPVEQAGGDERDFQAEGAQEVPSPVSQEYDRHLISLLRKGEALPGHQEEAADEIERLRDWNDHLNNTVLPNILNPTFLMLMKGGERLLDLCTKDGEFIGVSLNDMKDVFDWMVTHARIAPDQAALAQPSHAPELAERGTQHRFSTTEQTCRHDFAGVWWNDNGVAQTGRECRHCGFFVADVTKAQAEQAEAERPEGPTEDELEAAGLGYPLHKEEAVKLWYSGFRSEVITVLEAWEAIGHDIGMNPDKGELLDSLRYMLEKCEAHDAALAEVERIKTISDNYYVLCVERQQQLDAALARVEQQERTIAGMNEAHAKLAGLYEAAQAQHSVPGDIMRDAQRYRWLRDQQFYFSFSTENSDAGISSCTAGMSSRFKNLSWVDAAIDSAIAAAPGKEVGHE